MIEAFTVGSAHTNKNVISDDIESGIVVKNPSLIVPLQSSFLVHGTTPKECIDRWVSRAAHIMGAAIPDVVQPGAFVWFKKTQRSLMIVLPVSGWQPMKLFLLCGGLLNDHSVKGVLSLFFV
ncbi:uncharacterized protein TNCV_2268941 [Trichonephila clavipes]|nr:uncharacterized protein TNCV_2268941 [Trichonephila clavipes]